MSVNQNRSEIHQYFMNLALQQAKINIGNTKDNPSVGCVITKNNQLISASHTNINGRPHAESSAIKLSRHKVKNSFLYSTLEPCSNYGKTQPCVKLIAKKKIKKVFYSLHDPDKKSFNKSTKYFKKKGISTKTGIYLKTIQSFYESYTLSRKEGYPYVNCKLAVTKDLFINNKKEKWITNIYSLGRAHLMRSKYDCVITSSETVVTDNPLLTCRINGLEKKSPDRIILDNKLRIPLNSKILNKKLPGKTIIFYNHSNIRKINLIKNLGIKLFVTPLDRNGNLDLKKILIKLKKLGYHRILLETGLKMSTNFFKNKLINKFSLFISDINIKNNGYNNINFFFKSFLKNKKYTLKKVNLFGERLLSYKIK